MHNLKAKAVMAGAAAMALIMSSAPAFAANYTAIPGTQTQLEKVMIVDNDAEIPAATFTFTASAGQAVDATATTVKVWPGTSPELVKINGAARQGTVTFAAGEAKTAGAANDTYANSAEKSYATKTIELDFSGINYSEPGVYRYLITETSPTSPISAVGETVTTVDVYVQDNGSGLEVQGYVAYDGTVTAAPKVATDTTTIPTLDGKTPNGAEAAAKDDKFRNELSTNQIEFGKEVTGNQGSKDQYFAFTVTLNNLGAGTVLTAEPSETDILNPHANTATSYDAEDMQTANRRDDSSKYLYDGTEYNSESLAHAAAFQDIDSTTVAGKFIFGGVEYDTEEEAEAAAEAACIAPKTGQQLIADASGSVTWTVYLHDGQYYTIKGLPEGATYAITEASAAGYTTTEGIVATEGKGGNAYQDAVQGTIGQKMETTLVQDDEGTLDANGEPLADAANTPAADRYSEQTAPAADQDVMTGYTNDRTGVLPTGVMMAVVPGAIAIAAGLGGAFAIKARRRKEEDDED